MKNFLIEAIRLLPSKKRRHIYLLCFLGSMIALLDAVILLSIPTLFSTKSSHTQIAGQLANTWQLLIGLGLILVIKNLLFILFQYYKNNYLARLQTFFSQKVLSSAVMSVDRKHHDVGGLLSSVIMEPLQVILNVYGPMINLTVEISLALLLFVVLLWLHPFESIFLGIGVLILLVVYQHGVKKKNLTWGQIRAASDAERSEWARAAIASADEINAMGKFDFIIDEFHRISQQSSKMVANKATTMDISKNIVELSVILSAGTSAIVFYALFGRSMTELMVVMASFAFAAYRLMPSLNRIMIASQSIRYGRGSFEKIKSSLETRIREPKTINHQKITQLELGTSCLSIGGRIIKGFSCRILRGEILLIKGESGVGKSTLLRAILHGAPGLSIKVDGEDIKNGLLDSHISIAYMGQTASVMPTNLPKNISLSNVPLRTRTMKAMKSLGLEGLLEREKLEHEKLSGGQRSRISFLRGVDCAASIYLMDEPTSALDMDTKELFKSEVALLAKDAMVVIVSHEHLFDDIASNTLEIKFNA